VQHARHSVRRTQQPGSVQLSLQPRYCRTPAAGRLSCGIDSRVRPPQCPAFCPECTTFADVSHCNVYRSQMESSAWQPQCL
jgi:hypothetical protein